MRLAQLSIAASLALLGAACESDTPAAPPPPVQVLSTLEQGQAALRLGDLPRAAKLCGEAAAETNPSPWAFACVADAERGLGNKAGTEQALLGYVERVPADVVRRHALSRLYLEDGRYPQAQIQLDRVSQLGLATAETFFLVAEIFRLQGNCQAAIGGYRQSLRIDPNYSPTHDGLARARREICPIEPSVVRRPPPPPAPVAAPARAVAPPPPPPVVAPPPPPPPPPPAIAPPNQVPRPSPLPVPKAVIQ